jgi:hypothetical protein
MMRRHKHTQALGQTIHQRMLCLDADIATEVNALPLVFNQ